MKAKIELIASGSYADALKAGQAAADKLTKGATNVTINARHIKKQGHWKVIIKYKRVEVNRQPFNVDDFFNAINNSKGK